jgi:hypothetical protein
MTTVFPAPLGIPDSRDAKPTAEERAGNDKMFIACGVPTASITLGLWSPVLPGISSGETAS